MKAAHGITLVVALAACGASSRSGDDDTNDGGGDDGEETTCTNGTTLPLPAGTPYAALSDGTTVYVALTTATTDQLYAIPLAGGTPTLVETATAGNFALSSAGNAVFYAAQLGGADYKVHERVGTNDRLLGTLVSSTQLVIAANATDVFTAGTSGGDIAIKSFSRAGQPDQFPVVVSTSNGNAMRLSLGTTIVAWQNTPSSWRYTTLPGPGTPMNIAGQIGDPVEMAGDAAFSLTAMTQSADTISYKWNLLHPTSEVVANVSMPNFYLQLRGADAAHLFVEERTVTDPSQNTSRTRLMSYGLDGAHHFAGMTELCNYGPTLIGQDATRLYVVGEGGLVVFPIP